MTAPPGAAYSLREIQQQIGLAPAAVRALVSAGFVTPQIGPRRAWRFSFQDLLLLRTAHALHAAQVPTRRIVTALQRLRAQLPAEAPLTGLRIRAVGAEVAVVERGAPRDVASGQWLLDFEWTPTEAAAQVLSPRFGRSAGPPDAATAPASAQAPAAPKAQQGPDDAAAHRRSTAEAEAVTRGPAQPAAQNDLSAVLAAGARLGDAGRPLDATRLYHQTLEHGLEHPALWFNLAIALEDLGEPAAAERAYRRCLSLDPGFCDAHFNLGRLCELDGRRQEAIRHYAACRRQSPQG